MPSNINPNIITPSPVSKTDMKQQLTHARDEITELQERALYLYDFGAVGNGIADDTAAINAWLNAVLTTGRPGYMGAGHFRYTGAQLMINIGGVAATHGGMIYGAGGSRSIIDVSACTNTPQFLVRCQGNFLFYWTFRGFEVRGNRDGVMAQFGQNWTGSAYPDALNSCSIEDVVFRNNSTGTNAVAVRLNKVLETRLHIIANNGNTTGLTGTAVELHGVQFSCGKIAAGNARYGLAFRHYTYGNSFNCDLEVLQTLVLLDTISGWNRLSGQMVWGAPNSNPVLSGLDGTTTAIEANAAGQPLVFGYETNWGSATNPSITGSAIDQVWALNRGLGRRVFEGARVVPVRDIDATWMLIPRTGRAGWLQLWRDGSPQYLRWNVGMTSASNLVVQRFSPTGTFIDEPWYVDESSGFVVSRRAQAVVSQVVPSYAVASLPSPNPAAQVVYVTNEVGGPVLAFSDGTNWRRCTDRAIVS